MLETISALKTNNARKIPNYDPSLLEHMKKLLRGSIRSTGEYMYMYIKTRTAFCVRDILFCMAIWYD